MFLQLFPSNILQAIFLFTIPLILLKPPRFHAQEIQQFSECQNQTTFNCGENILKIVYPFWGGNRPSYCGLEGFELTCKNDDFTTIDIDSLTFRVLSINQSGHEIKIARSDIQDDTNICPPVITSTNLSKTIFGYNPGTEIIYLYYDCPFELNIDFPDSSVWGNFTCTKNGAENYGFYAGELFKVDELRKFEACRTEMVAAVMREAFREYRENVSMSMLELLKEGFLMNYIIDEIACSACASSGGLCGSDFENSRRFQCICRNGVHRFTCPNRGVFILSLPLSLSLSWLLNTSHKIL